MTALTTGRESGDVKAGAEHERSDGRGQPHEGVYHQRVQGTERRPEDVRDERPAAGRWLFVEAANRGTSVLASRSSIGYGPGSIYRVSSRRREDQPDSVRGDVRCGLQDRHKLRPTRDAGSGFGGRGGVRLSDDGFDVMLDQRRGCKRVRFGVVMLVSITTGLLRRQSGQGPGPSMRRSSKSNSSRQRTRFHLIVIAHPRGVGLLLLWLLS
jgi:hypothetical protein